MNTFALRAAQVFDGDRIRRDLPVLVEDGRIAAVDLHTHRCGDGGTGTLDRPTDYPEDELDQVIETALRKQLAAGVTTVRDLGDRRYATLCRRGRPGLPTILAAGSPSPRTRTVSRRSNRPSGPGWTASSTAAA